MYQTSSPWTASWVSDGPRAFVPFPIITSRREVHCRPRWMASFHMRLSELSITDSQVDKEVRQVISIVLGLGLRELPVRKWVLDAFLDAFHCCCTLLIVAKLGDMARRPSGALPLVVLWVPKWNLPQSLRPCRVHVQLIVRMACSLAPGYTCLREWLILTVPRPWHNRKTARIPRASKNNDH